MAFDVSIVNQTTKCHDNTKSVNQHTAVGSEFRIGGKGKFRPTSKRNSCRVCGDTSGKCRSTDSELVLCANVDRYSIPPGWRWIKSARNPLWQIIAPDTGDSTPQQRSEWRRANTAKREEQAQKERQRIANGLTREQRHSILSAKPNTLTAAQNADLLRRGLAQAEIDACLSNGWLWAERGGYGIAAIDAVTGQIIGGQLARDDRSPKYSWGIFSGGNQLPESGELPIAYWKRPENWPKFELGKTQNLERAKSASNPDSEPVSQPTNVGLAPYINSQSLLVEILATEGYLKSLITAIKCWRSNPSIVVIGAAGGQFAGSKSELMRAIEGSGLNRLALCPDSGMGFNTQVLGNYQALFEFLESEGWVEGLEDAGCELAILESRIADLQTEVDAAVAADNAAIAAGTLKRNGKKSATPLKRQLKPLLNRAEVLRDRVAGGGVSVLWWNQFRKSDPDIDELSGQTVQRIRPSEYRRTGFFGVSKSELDQYLLLNRFTPDRTESTRYLSTAHPAIDAVVRLAIKSALGSGKTHWMGQLYKSHAAAGWDSLRGLVIVPTVALAENFTGRMGADFGLFFSHPRDFDFGDPSGNNLIVCCPESLHHIPDWWLDGAIVAIDEAVSIRRAIPQRNKRTERRAIEAKITRAIANAHQVYLFDANLTDRVTNWFELDTTRQFTKLENTYQRGHKTTLYAHRSTLQAKFEQIISAGQRFAYCGDSVRRIVDLIEHVGGEGTAAIHGLQTPDEAAAGEAMKSAPTEYLSQLAAADELLRVFLSPKANSGLSIDSEVGFDYVLEDFCGVLDSANQSQLGKRVRDGAAHHLAYVAPIGLWGTGASHKLIAQQIAEDLQAYTASIAAEFGEAGEVYAEMVGRLQTSDRAILDVEEMAIANFEKANLAQCYIWRQIQAGNTLEINFDRVETIALKEELKTIREQRELSETQRLQAAADIDRQEFERLEQREYLTHDERAQQQRYSLEQRLPGFTQCQAFADADFLQEAIKVGTIGHLENWYFLNHLEAAKKIQSARVLRTIQAGEVDAARLKSTYLRMKALINAGTIEMIELIKAQGEVTAADLEQYVWRLRKQQRSLALGALPKNPIKAVNKVLRLFGWELSQSKQSTETRYYKLVGLLPDLSAEYAAEICQLIEQKYSTLGDCADEIKVAIAEYQARKLPQKAAQSAPKTASEKTQILERAKSASNPDSKPVSQPTNVGSVPYINRESLLVENAVPMASIEQPRSEVSDGWIWDDLWGEWVSIGGYAAKQIA